MALDLTDFNAKQITTKIKEKKLSLAELGNTLGQRGIQAQEALNLFISFDPQFIVEGIKKIEQQRNNAEPGLPGVPIVLADNIATDDQKTTCASRLLATYRPPFAARVVNRLKENGAFFIGKTNLEEFNLGSSGESSFFKPIFNPWNVKCSAGSGAAAAVASGLTPLALASDTRGELRQAASYCGVMALKPTYGKISRKGLIDSAPSLEQIGLLSRQAIDLAVTLQILAASEPDNPTMLQTGTPPYAALLDDAPANLQIAIPACWDEAPYLQDEVKNEFLEQLASLEKLGLKINFVKVPHLKDAAPVAAMICAVETFSNLSNMDGVRFGYREKGDHLQDMYIKTRSQGFSGKLKRFITFGSLLSTPQYYTLFQQGQKMRTVIRQELENCLQDNDLLLTPTTPFQAISADSPVYGKEYPDPASFYTAAANLAGFPALSFPIFKGPLPGSLQFIAKKENEVALLQMASLLEKEYPLRWPKFALALQEV